MGIVGFYAKEKEVGKFACCKAIAAEKKEEDINNLKFYIEDNIQREQIIECLKTGKTVDLSSNTNRVSSESDSKSKLELKQSETPILSHKQKMYKRMENLKNLRKGK